MRQFPFPFLVALLLLPFAQQDTSQPAASVADAARASRQRKNLSGATHVLTDEDLAKGLDPNLAAASVDAAEVRSQMERNYPNPTVAELKFEMESLAMYPKYPEGELLRKFKREALWRLEDENFAGKQEWEDELAEVVAHLIVENGRAGSRIETILQQSQGVLTNGDPAELRKVREQWIDAVFPSAVWSTRLAQLVEDGKKRVRAHLDNSGAALSAYRHARQEQIESNIGWIMSQLQNEEIEYKSRHGRYNCDLEQFPNKHEDLKTWNSYLDTVHLWGYRLSVEGCDSHHYSAWAVPAASDGVQGRAFCSSESSGVRIAEDGTRANCLSKGSNWHRE